MKTNNSNPTQGRGVYFDKRIIEVEPSSAPRFTQSVDVLHNATDADIFDALVSESEQFGDGEIAQGTSFTIYVDNGETAREYTIVTDNQFRNGYSEKKLLKLIEQEVQRGGKTVQYFKAY